MKAKIRKSSVIALSMAIIMLLTVLAPVEVSAAKGNPYRDVTVTRCGKLVHDSIWVLKEKGAYKGIIKGQNPRFVASKVATKWEIIKTLQNYYGVKNVPISANDKKTFRYGTNYKWLYWKLSTISKRKHDIIWDTAYSEGTKVTRARLAVTLAAIRDPYAADVSPAKIGKERSDAINWVKAHKGWKGVVTTRNFGPNKMVTRAEGNKVLCNLYNKSDVVIWPGDIRKPHYIIDHRWLFEKISYMENGGEPESPLMWVDNRFSVESPVTRATLAMVLRNYGTQQNPRPKVFPKQ